MAEEQVLNTHNAEILLSAAEPQVHGTLYS